MKKLLLLLSIVLTIFAFASCAMPGDPLTADQAKLTSELLSDAMSGAASSSTEANARALDLGLGEEGLSFQNKFSHKIANKEGTVVIDVDFESTVGVSSLGANAKYQFESTFNFKNYEYTVSDENGDIKVTLNGRFRFSNSLKADASATLLNAKLKFDMETPFPGLKIIAVQNEKEILNTYLNVELSAEGSLTGLESDMEFTGTINGSTIKNEFAFNWGSLITQ